MGKLIEERNGVNIFEYVAPKYTGISERISSTVAEGMRYKLYAWLIENGYDETIEDVQNNTSGVREGNEIHIHDDYEFDYKNEIYISYIYYHNDNTWAVLYDRENESWYGEFEL